MNRTASIIHKKISLPNIFIACNFPIILSRDKRSMQSMGRLKEMGGRGEAKGEERGLKGYK